MRRIRVSGPQVDQSAGDFLLHPFAIASLVLLVANDRLLKPAFHSPWTGILSDVAGLFLLILVLVAVAELGNSVGRGRQGAIGAVPLAVILVAVGLVFAFAKSTQIGSDLAGRALGVAKAPIRLLDGPPDSARNLVRPVIVLRDLSDLLALAALPVAWWFLRHRAVTPTSEVDDGRT